MENLYNLNMYHLIIRPHKYDEDKFKAFTPFVINWIQKKPSISFYSISEELGENGGYHLDIAIFSTADIAKNILNNKGKQIGLSGHATNFRLNNLPNTLNAKRYFHRKPESEKNSKEYNTKFIIGYSFKEQDCELKNWNNLENAQITKQDISDCLTFYRTHENSKEKPIVKDVIPLNTKNIMWEMKKYIMETYIDKNKPIRWDTIVTDTVLDDYCWVSVSEKQTRKLILQLKLKFDEIEDHEKNELNLGVQKVIDDQVKEELMMVRSVGTPKEERLKYLYEYGFISKNEYKLLCP